MRSLLRASHLGPTLAVTLVSFLLATALWWEGPAYFISFGVFLGQLLVGWTNDLNDYQDDLKHNRTNKPLVAGTITPENLRKTTFIFIPIAVIANLIGPLGLKGGSVYLLGVGCGIAYNFYFKFSPLSPLPYAIALAALPASVYFAVDRTPPLWVLAGGSLLGVGFHFLNVLKDIEKDQSSSIKGLPQIVGKRASAAIALVLISVAIMVVINR